METEEAFSLNIEGCLDTCPYCSALYICVAIPGCAGCEIVCDHDPGRRTIEHKDGDGQY